MVALLKGLLGKSNRPIVINGKLLCQGRNPVVVSLLNYRVVFSVLGSNEEIASEAGENMITQVIKDYGSRYDEILSGARGIVADEVSASVDTFTGAVILETPAYQALSREDMHRVGVQHSTTVSQLVHDFVAEYTMDYFDSYVYLLNRRIAAQHMPIMVRGHFVSGLFQPLVVGTKAIPSPFVYGENHWFHDILASQEEYLERSMDSTRKLDLSCVAMCDICSTFQTPVIYELDRKVFMLMLELILLSQLNQESSAVLIKKYNHLFKRALYNPEQAARSAGQRLTEEQLADAKHRNAAQLFTDMMDYTTKLRTAIRTV